MASLGHEVTGVDIDEAKVEALTSGHPPFFEPGLSELLVKAQEKGRLEFTTDVSRAAGAQVHFVCVGTPQKPGEFAADVTYVDAAVDSLREHLTSTSVVVGKSTRSEEHTSELQSRFDLVCRLLLAKKKITTRL